MTTGEEGADTGTSLVFLGAPTKSSILNTEDEGKGDVGTTSISGAFAGSFLDVGTTATFSTRVSFVAFLVVGLRVALKAIDNI